MGQRPDTIYAMCDISAGDRVVVVWADRFWMAAPIEQDRPILGYTGVATSSARRNKVILVELDKEAK